MFDIAYFSIPTRGNNRNELASSSEWGRKPAVFLVFWLVEDQDRGTGEEGWQKKGNEGEQWDGKEVQQRRKQQTSVPDKTKVPLQWGPVKTQRMTANHHFINTPRWFFAQALKQTRVPQSEGGAAAFSSAAAVNLSLLVSANRFSFTLWSFIHSFIYAKYLL